jgi:hypothetical protein|tara:strand:- start:369 stop:818 length:450 start_codon:yes stop_codon:yes gene_type:complete
MSKTKWQLEQEALENAFARRLLVEYNIKEVTTQRQAKNGTREFFFPVSTYQNTNEYYKRWMKSTGKSLKDTPRLRLAVFQSGVVRKQNGTYSPYQLNKQYKQNRRTTFLVDGKLETKEYVGTARALIYSQIARMQYMLEYYLKNYKSQS